MNETKVCRQQKSHIKDGAFWQKTILAWRESGLSQERFCANRGLSHHIFRDRLHRFRKLDPEFARARKKPLNPANAMKFVPVRIVSSNDNDGSRAVAVRCQQAPLLVNLQGRRSITVSGDFDESIFRKLLRVLEDPSC